MENEMTELKPCPFCGNAPEMESEDGFSFVRCYDQHCKADARSGLWLSESEAIEAWNTRAPVVVTDEMVERALDAYVKTIYVPRGGVPYEAVRNALGAVLNGGEK